MTKKELVRRYMLLIVGLFLSALGVAFTKHGELGVSPISSVANVLSYKFTFFTLGTWLIIWNCILIVGQIIILRKEFQPIQLLQVPLSFLFGYFTDFGLWCVSTIPADCYLIRLLMVFIGTIILGLGISLAVIANVIMNSGEAFVKAVSDANHREFGNVKIVFDVSCVISAVILSLLFFDFRIIGTREGTVLSAVFTGFVVKFFSTRLKKPLTGIWMK
ncbi:MAG: YitT family protein [Lachnospiraceae bacterium]|nr:YitT family protein [Lachnospiraceae bacterium]